MKYLMIIISVMIQLCVFSLGNVCAEILFQEDFEDANFIQRGWYDVTGSVLSSTEHVRGSAKSLECKFLVGQTIPNGGVPKRHKFQETESIYLSYWIKYSSNWIGQAAAYDHHEFYVLTNKNDDWSGLAWTKLTGYIEQNHGRPYLSIQDGENIEKNQIGVDLKNITETRAVAGCNGDSDSYGNGECYQIGSDYYNGKHWVSNQVTFSNDAGARYKADWHRVEVYFKLNSISNGKAVPDGIIRYWFDDQVIMDFNKVIFRTGQHPDMKFNQFVLAPFLGDGSVAEQEFWIDNLVLATERISSNSSPAAPQNFRIINK